MAFDDSVREKGAVEENAPPVSPTKHCIVLAGLILFYVFLILTPLVAAWLQGLPARPWLDDLSSALALCAFSGLMIEFVLSGRFRFVSGHIGTDTTMRVHQLMARVFALFILVHPYLYVSRAPNYAMPWDTTRQLSINYELAAILPGIIAWIALMFIVITGIFRNQQTWSYETWRLMHGVGAAVVAIGGTLHALDAGRYSQHPFLAWFWTLLLVLALCTLVWVYLLKPLWLLRKRYSVRSVRKIADRTWEVVIAPDGSSALRFEAGQFVWLNVGSNPFLLNENPFSIASAPAQRDRLAFVIKEVGDFTRRVGSVEPGQVAYVDGPHGNMTITGRREPGIAFYAGGVGVAPIMSIVRELNHRGDQRPLLLIYGNRTANQIVYEDELAEMAQRLRLKVDLTLSEPTGSWTGNVGLIDAAALDRALPDPEFRSWLHVICGPMPMIEGVEAHLLAKGVASSKIVSERFYYD